MKGKSLLQSFRENVTGEVQQTGFMKPSKETLQMVSDDHDPSTPKLPPIHAFERCPFNDFQPIQGNIITGDDSGDSRINDDGTLNDVDGQVDMSKLEPRDVTADLKKHISW